MKALTIHRILSLFVVPARAWVLDRTQLWSMVELVDTTWKFYYSNKIAMLPFFLFIIYEINILLKIMKENILEEIISTEMQEKLINRATARISLMNRLFIICISLLGAVIFLLPIWINALILILAPIFIALSLTLLYKLSQKIKKIEI